MSQSASILESLASALPAAPSAAKPEPQADTFSRSRDLWLAAVEAEALRLRDAPDINLNQADIRFSSALNLETVRRSSVAIVGAGAIGNAQWRAVLGMGFHTVAIFDDDVVGLENIGPQGHNITDLGLPKVEAVRRAALQYRGVEIMARNRRVDTLEDIASDLGFMPDYVITCTDSTAFRNGFIAELGERLENLRLSLRGLSRSEKLPRIEQSLPALVLDFRMSLGDWNCFALPCRAIAASILDRNTLSEIWKTYTDIAVFEPDQAVQEPCTERSIVYTGANTASYTGAFLHWWLNKGQSQLSTPDDILAFFNLKADTAAGEETFCWLMSYSSREWRQITPTPTENALRGHGAHLRATLTRREKASAKLAAYILGRDCTYIDPAEVRPGDFVYAKDMFARCTSSSGLDLLSSEIAVVRRGAWRRAIIGKALVELAFRPGTPVPSDILFTGEPGRTRITGIVTHDDGRMETVTELLHAVGNELRVGSHNIFLLEHVKEAPLLPLCPEGLPVTPDTVEDGDIIILPRVDPSTRFEVLEITLSDLMIRPENTDDAPGKVGRHLLEGMLKVGRVASDAAA